MVDVMAAARGPRKKYADPEIVLGLTKKTVKTTQTTKLGLDIKSPKYDTNLFEF